MITICTVLRSQKYYNSSWVDKMKRSLEKHMTMPFNFLPLSDGVHDFNHHTFKGNLQGYWNKIELFRPGVYTGPTLFIDADNLIIGDLTPMIEALKGHKFVMYKSRTTDWHPTPTPSSCVMYWEDDVSYIWDLWNSKSPEYWYKEYRKNGGTGRKGDQGFIREHARNLELIHDIYPQTYDMIKFVEGPQPDLSGVSMLVFAGKTKPNNTDWEVIKREWV